ncbi:MAG: Holliday junction branch migration protein RuvA [Verrucomicrobiales bacterium]|nr:Holliday junction branch migration protein RuvA [Verrucomicrobiales bacterium]
MISFLQGTLEETWPGRIIVNVNGVGYEIIVPGDGDFGQMGDKTKVLTHFHVREQEQTLFGFPNEDTRDLFRLLIGRVSGVGPKVAMSILSGMAASDFKQAVVEGDLNAIAKIKGLGKKTAERVVLELRDKVGVKDAWETQTSATATPIQRARGDAMLGLIALGYKQLDARKAVDQVPDAVTNTDEILREALKFLR